jgi:hypothetical protein
MSNPPRDETEQIERDDMAGAVRGTRKLPRGTPLIERLRDIVTSKSAARVDGLLVDLFTASAMVQVHDALSPPNQAKFAALPLRRMVDVGWKVIKNAEAKT